MFRFQDDNGENTVKRGRQSNTVEENMEQFNKSVQTMKISGLFPNKTETFGPILHLPTDPKTPTTDRKILNDLNVTPTRPKNNR